ncbi:hypothetical protein DSL72_009243 [Monilinia vaccinii-corymbosi]|uniref:O-methyltransferase domain-containing protein n=1 Tax=Monilinia vaccinii-corymbosi TaxID=61207 RepID=A0A8A3PQI4_9HELO|nr:hypothetical protein DSL72_009243 [Monilinia vaccinii-corymbosi]
MAIDIFQRAAVNWGRRFFSASKSTRLPCMISSTTESAVAHKFVKSPHLHYSLVSKSPVSSLVKLAAKITRETEKLSAYLKDNGIEEPNFDVSSAVAFPKLPEDLRKSREEIITATEELRDLVTGAKERLQWLAWDFYNVLSLRAIYHYNIAKVIPLGGTATFEEIAQKVGLDVINVRRFMRHAMSNRIFQEVKPEVVSHTAASKMLAEDQSMMDWVGTWVEEGLQAADKTIEALTKYPSASEPTQTGFCLANGTMDIEPFYVTIERNHLRAKRFGGAMISIDSSEGYELSHLVENYDWASLDFNSGTIVDLGGSHGLACVELAKRFSNLNFVVQDSPKAIANAPALDASLSPRIKYMVHDFHTPQPIRNADLYFFRWIMHNHSNKYATNILRQLKPALKKGARVLINDYCLPEAGNGAVGLEERAMRTMDMNMLTFFNSQERSESDWIELFGPVKGFRFLGVKRPVGSRLSLIEAVWEGEESEESS